MAASYNNLLPKVCQTITATGDQISIDLTDDVTTIQAYNLAVPTAVPGVIDASSVTVSAYNTIPSGFLDNALKVLADQNFRVIQLLQEAT